MNDKEEIRWGVTKGGPWHCSVCGKLKTGKWVIRINRSDGYVSAQICSRCAMSISQRWIDYGSGKGGE